MGATTERPGAAEQPIKVEPELVVATQEVLRRVDRPLRDRMLSALLRFYRAPPARRQAALRDLARELASVAILTSDDWVLYSALAELLRGGRPTMTGLEHLVCTARWGELRTPTLHLSGKQAAALMLSDLTDEQLANLEPPWRALLLVLDEPLAIGDDRAESVQILCWQSRFLGWFSESRNGWWTVWTELDADRAMSQVSHPRRLYHDTPMWPDGFSPNVAYAESLAPLQSRAQSLLTRLALNIAVALQDDGDGAAARVRARRRRRKGDKRRRVLTLQGGRAHDLDFDVAIDVREHVADYLSGDIQRVYKVRWIVCGHWRNQPCGPGRLLRRRTWIAPHWKGKEGAPVVSKRRGE